MTQGSVDRVEPISDAPAPVPDEVAANDEHFQRSTAQYRRELYAHCYRMVGSPHEAEDLVQETYLRAWRAYRGFENRSTVRTWMYRIATNVCLDALAGQSRRPLPTGLGAPSSDPTGELVRHDDVPWLEPAPDVLLGVASADPADVAVERSSVRLALVAALQHLPPRQRAVLVLRDVLAMRAAEVADLLDTSTTAVNSSLQRARSQLHAAGLREHDLAEPSDPDQRALVDRYARAMAAKDIDGLVDLFTADAVWEMPPFTGWYEGPVDIGRLVATQCPAGPDELRLVPVGSNGQPAFGVYLLGADGGWHAFQLHVLTLSGGGISHVASFQDTALYAFFDLPMTLPA